MSENFYVKDARLVEFVNSRGDQVFSPAQLKDRLKGVCGALKQDNFVRDWLDLRLEKKEIGRLNQGIYKKKRTLESKYDFLRRCLGMVPICERDKVEQ